MHAFVKQYWCDLVSICDDVPRLVPAEKQVDRPKVQNNLPLENISNGCRLHDSSTWSACSRMQRFNHRRM